MLAGDQLRQVLALLRFRAPAADLVDAEIRMRAVRQADRARGPAQLFHRHDVREIAEAGTAELRFHRDAEQAELAEPRPEVARKLDCRDRCPRRAVRPPRAANSRTVSRSRSMSSPRPKSKSCTGHAPRHLHGDPARCILSDNPMISQPKTRTRTPERPDRRKIGSGPVMFERLSPQPAYRRVSIAIEEKILRRTLRPGDTLPTETELARQFGVNRSTVREALRRLESAGPGRSRQRRQASARHPPRSGRDRLAREPRARARRGDVHRALGSDARHRTAHRRARRRARDAATARRGSTRSSTRVEAARNADAPSAAVVEFFGLVAELAGNRVLVMSTQPLDAPAGAVAAPHDRPRAPGAVAHRRGRALHRGSRARAASPAKPRPG